MIPPSLRRQPRAEINARGMSYTVNKWGGVSVPSEDAEPLRKVGGFSDARADDKVSESAFAGLSDVHEVVCT